MGTLAIFGAKFEGGDWVLNEEVIGPASYYDQNIACGVSENYQKFNRLRVRPIGDI